MPALIRFSLSKSKEINTKNVQLFIHFAPFSWFATNYEYAAEVCEEVQPPSNTMLIVVSVKIN